MKLGVFTASTLIGVVSLASASFAQGDVGATLSRAPQSDAASISLSRAPTPGAAPELQSARPPAGFLPQTSSGSARNYAGEVSNTPAASRDIRNDLRRQ